MTDPADGAIEIRLGESCPDGRHAESITIVTDDPIYPEIKLPVTIDRERQRQITALPGHVTLVAGGSAVVQLRAASGEPVLVETVEASVPTLTCRWAAGPGDRATLRIGLDRTKWDGKPFTGDVRVRLRAPAAEPVVITASVRAEE